MFILLSGASETARSLIVDKILEKHADWRHLAMEDLQEDGVWSWDQECGPDILIGAIAACEFARQEHDEGHSVIITCPAFDLVESARDAFADELVTVHMGTEVETRDIPYDYTLDPAEHSASATVKELEKIIASV